MLDAKQLPKGSAKTSQTVSGAVQMTDPWVIEVLNNLDKQSSAYKAVTAAIDNGTLVKGVAGVDRATGKLIIMKVK